MNELETNKLSKEEFIYWANWISTRWSNVKTDPKSIKSLYADFLVFPDDILGKAAIEQLDLGDEFFSWPKLKKRCKELYNEYLIEKINQTKNKEKIEELQNDKPGSLGAYLKSQGWKSFEEAVFYKTVELYRKKQLYKPGMEAFKKYKDMDYKQARENGWVLGLKIGVK